MNENGDERKGKEREDSERDERLCSLFHESDDDLPDILDEGIPVFVGDSDWQ